MSVCIYVHAIYIHTHTYRYTHTCFLPTLCKRQIVILFPLMNQIFNPEFTTQAFYLAQFATDSVRALLRYSLNIKLMKSSPFVSELILGDRFVSYRHQGPGSPCSVSLLLISRNLFILHPGCLETLPGHLFFRCQHTLRLYLAANSQIMGN